MNGFDINVQKNLTTINFNSASNRQIKFIVIHYTANNGDTAKSNTNYFKSINRNASAHYFVDNTSIWQCVEDKNVAWHCGGGLQGLAGHKFFNICTNSNSIGIEMCSRQRRDGTYYIDDDTINNTIKLTKYLMIKYGIPSENVIRHFDVTGKLCPLPFVKANGNMNGSYSDTEWDRFKTKLDNYYDAYLNYFTSAGIILEKDYWSSYSSPIIAATAITFIDKATSTWGYDVSIEIKHPAEPYVYSMAAKGGLTLSCWLENLNDPIAKSYVCAMIDKITGPGTQTPTTNWAIDARNRLYDRKIIYDLNKWKNLDDIVTAGEMLEIVYGLKNKNQI